MVSARRSERSVAHVCTIVKPKSLQVERLSRNTGKSQTEDPRGTDNETDKSCPKGMPDVSDSRARHVDASSELGCVSKVYRAPPQIGASETEPELVGGDHPSERLLLVGLGQETFTLANLGQLLGRNVRIGKLRMGKSLPNNSILPKAVCCADANLEACLKRGTWGLEGRRGKKAIAFDEVYANYFFSAAYSGLFLPLLYPRIFPADRPQLCLQTSFSVYAWSRIFFLAFYPYQAQGFNCI